MDAVHVVSRVALGIVFVVAGASKVASGRRWPDQAAQLGVARPVAHVVPWFELAVGALLVVGLGRTVMPAVAIGALVVFTFALVRVLRLGRRPPCACFGSWSARPLGWGHVARNAAFVALGVAALISR